ncbi:MAG: hypothetical protein J0H44_11705 [Alphaproteobacteria bacterium]|nr:hypothetical protein [Alphaproteobacteria bacterium]
MSTTTAAVPTATTAAPRSVQWGAVLLGAVGAIAISFVLLTFGAGIGLSAVSAQPYAGASAKALAVTSALYAAIVAVGSFAAGGYIAGRMRMPPTPEEVEEAHFRDGAHGFAVWAVAMVVFAIVAASGISGAIKTVTQATATVSGATAAGAASNPSLGQISMSPTDYAVDRLLAPAPGSSSGNQQQAAAQGRDNAPILRAFGASLKSGQLAQRDKDMLVGTVMQRTGLPQADAEKRVDESYAELKQAEQKVRDTAEAARKAALITAFATAAIALIGCAAACVGASAGADHRHKRMDILLFGSRRFW